MLTPADVDRRLRGQEGRNEGQGEDDTGNHGGASVRGVREPVWHLLNPCQIPNHPKDESQPDSKFLL